jgi:hypothetical protein
VIAMSRRAHDGRRRGDTSIVSCGQTPSIQAVLDSFPKLFDPRELQHRSINLW